MDTQIVAIYCICDDILKGLQPGEDKQRQMSDAEVMITIELKSNFLGTAREGTIACVGTRAHSGRITQVWDAEVTDEARGKTIALFRCTQLILYPR